MAIEPNELRSVMGQFASGVTIITTHDGAGHELMRYRPDAVAGAIDHVAELAA